MATVAEDFRKALQDIVAPDLKVIATEMRELKEIVKSQGTGFYSALHGLNQKLDDVRQDLDQRMDGINSELRGIKTEIKKLGNGSSR